MNDMDAPLISGKYAPPPVKIVKGNVKWVKSKTIDAVSNMNGPVPHGTTSHAFSRIHQAATSIQLWTTWDGGE